MKFTTAIASAILGFVAGSATAAAVPRGAETNGIIEVLSADKADNGIKGNGIIEVLSTGEANNDIKGNGIIEVLSADKSNDTIKGNGIIEVLSADKKGGFGETCHNPRLDSRIINENQHIYSIHATCADNKDQWVKTHIQLNRCLKNDDGDLAWANVGYFDDSCKDCILTTSNEDESEILLTCTCIGARDNRPTPSTINLNDGIRNSFGVIWCGEQTGYIEELLQPEPTPRALPPSFKLVTAELNKTAPAAGPSDPLAEFYQKALEI
ncbi:hypothetical protein CkaCkLH20_08166 [Colletotrichum karsti]|uniref:Cyanovirin-N domain-containing protein n=1 Tax=Colletotrichum karsti TaxID=1095194 RepID=A0A9P6LI22_9PEZI|nr:uncharacterized protein CkaCkLH20_08166 [Colletotrichum karsti]KAF9874183.1 hypothetical protein CkaCkLH20_08166 [Colletotrichum karsti]